MLITVLICSAGACLIQRELSKLNESTPVLVQRVLGNIREAAKKILLATVTNILLASAFIACQEAPHGMVPNALIHLLLVLLHANITVVLSACGEYLAAERVGDKPLWWVAKIWGWLASRALCCGKQRSRLFLEGEEQVQHQAATGGALSLGIQISGRANETQDLTAMTCTHCWNK